MTQYRNNLSAWVDGVTPSLANSGLTGGTAFTNIVPGTGVLEGSAAHPLEGAMGMHILAPASTGVYSEWKLAGAVSGAQSAIVGVIMPPAGNTNAFQHPVIQWRSGTTTIASLMINGSNRFQIVNRTGGDAAAGTINIPWAFTNSIWAEMYIAKGTGTVGVAPYNGSAKFRWYVGNTLQETITSKMGVYDVGVTDIDAVRFGRGSTPAGAIEYWLGGMGLDTAPATPTNPADGFMGLPAGGAVTANVTYLNCVFIDATPSTGPVGGPTLSYEIAPVSPNTQVPVQRNNGVWTVVPDADVDTSYLITVSNGTSTDTFDVPVPKVAVGGTVTPGHSRVRKWNGTTLTP